MFGLLKAHPHLRLAPEIVDLVGLHGGQQIDQPGPVGEVAVVQEEPSIRVVLVLVEMIDPRRGEGGRPADQTMHLVALAEQKLGQVRPVLAGDAGDECSPGHPGPLPSYATPAYPGRRVRHGQRRTAHRLPWT